MSECCAVLLYNSGNAFAAHALPVQTMCVLHDGGIWLQENNLWRVNMMKIIHSSVKFHTKKKYIFETQYQVFTGVKRVDWQ